MYYYPLFLLDSGIADFKENHYTGDYTDTHFIKATKEKGIFPDRLPELELFMTKKRGSNSLNDFISSDIKFTVSRKVKDILEKHCLPPHRFLPVQIHRETKSKGVTETKAHPYFWFYFTCEHVENYYRYIDFEKSEISFFNTKNKKSKLDMKLKNIDELHQIVRQNGKIASEIDAIYKRKDLPDEQKKELCKNLDTIGWQAETIVMNDQFNQETDVFCLPLFSHLTYVSKRLLQHFYGAEITGVRFGEVANKNPGTANSGSVEIAISQPW